MQEIIHKLFVFCNLSHIHTHGIIVLNDSQWRIVTATIRALPHIAPLDIWTETGQKNRCHRTRRAFLNTYTHNAVCCLFNRHTKLNRREITLVIILWKKKKNSIWIDLICHKYNIINTKFCFSVRNVVCNIKYAAEKPKSFIWLLTKQ